MVSDLIQTLAQKLPKRKKRGEYPYHRVFKINGESFYCYDDIGDISNARRIQIDAILDGSVKLNISRKTQQTITKKMHDQAQVAHAFLVGFITDFSEAIKAINVNPMTLISLEKKNHLKHVLIMLENLKNVNLEMSKRANMLTLPYLIYEVAAILFFTKKDDPRAMISEEEINRRIEIFKKKDVLKELLEMPMSNIFFQLQPLQGDSRSYFLLRLKETQAIANWQEEILQDTESMLSITEK